MTRLADPSRPSALAGARADPGVLALRPDYRALLMVAAGVRGGPSDEASEAALRRAEQSAAQRLAGGPPESLPQIAAWRESFRQFGVKPRTGRSSVEALLRRLDSGLPRIDRLTDHYNAVSVAHLIPIGGEDLGRYVGPPHLVIASGDEPFDTIADGEPLTQSPDPGEVVWRDDAGVTCRRWNWRQCVRTRLSPDTVDALFIFDALDPVTTDTLTLAAQELTERLRADAPDAVVTTRLIDSTG